MAAAGVVIGIPELLREIASHIYEPACLNQLCLVNHDFKDAFTPQLYRCMRWDGRNIHFLTDPDRRGYLFKDNKAAYIRIFIVAKSAVKELHAAWNCENPREEARWRNYDHWYFAGLEVIWTRLNDAIVDICQHASGLQTFACQDIAIRCDAVAALSSIPSLRNISIEFHEDGSQIPYVDTDATAQSLARFIHPAELFSFAGLRRLSLLGLWGNIMGWRNQILRIMLESPDLELLALSVSRDASYESDDETQDRRAALETDMFQWLSREYEKATGRPLQFKFTKFHYGTIIPNAIVVEGWAIADSLEPVYIWNEDNGPFLKGLGAFPISDIGPQLADSEDDEP